MKRTWIVAGKVSGKVLRIALPAALAVAGTLTINLALAQTGEADPAAPPPIPPIQPKIVEEETPPSVVISDREGERIEEYSRDGRVYMVKITPIKGPAYWYFDEDGDGELELQDMDKGHGPVRPVYWKIKEW